MSHGNFVRALREFGVRGTFEKLYKMRTIKFGDLKGVDRYGNQYFENCVDYPHGAQLARRPQARADARARTPSAAPHPRAAWWASARPARERPSSTAHPAPRLAPR